MWKVTQSIFQNMGRGSEKLCFGVFSWFRAVYVFIGNFIKLCFWGLFLIKGGLCFYWKLQKIMFLGSFLDFRCPPEESWSKSNNSCTIIQVLLKKCALVFIIFCSVFLYFFSFSILFVQTLFYNAFWANIKHKRNW